MPANRTSAPAPGAANAPMRIGLRPATANPSSANAEQAKPSDEPGLSVQPPFPAPETPKVARTASGVIYIAVPPRRPRPAPRTTFMLPAVSRRTYGTAVLLLIGAVAFVLGALAISRAGLLSANFAVRDVGCDEFSPQRSVVATEGASVRVNPDDLQGRFGVRLTSSRISPEASQKLPTALKPVTGLYAMKTCRVLPSAMTLSLAIPSHLVNAADLRGLDVYGWDGSSWYWLGGMVDAITRKVSTEVVRPPTHFALVQVQDDKPVIGIELPMRDANTGGERVNLPNQLVNEVMPFGVYLGDRGELAGELGGHDWRAAATTPNARSAKSYPVVRNWGSNGVVNRAVLRNLLRSDHAQAAHIKKLLAFVNAGQHAGVAVDYRGLGAAQRDDYVVFLRTLAEALHTAGKRLVVVIAPALDLDQVGQWQNGAYDWRAIAAIADQVHLDLSQEPAVLTSQALDNLMQWAVAHINRRKLQVVVPSLSLRYGAGPAGPFVELVNLDEALRTCALVGDATAPQVPGGTLQFRLKVDGMVDVVYDEATQTYHYSTANAAGAQTTVWLGTSASFRHKLEIIGKYRVRGVTVRGLTSTGNDSGIVPVLEGFAARRLTSSAAPAPLQVSMQWSKAFVTVAQSGAEAQPIVAQVSGAAVQVQLPQEPGEYALTSTVNGINAIATTPQRVKVGAP